MPYALRFTLYALRFTLYALRIIRTYHHINDHTGNSHIKPKGPGDPCQFFMFVKSFLEGPLQSEEHKRNDDATQNNMTAQNKIIQISPVACLHFFGVA